MFPSKWSSAPIITLESKLDIHFIPDKPGNRVTVKETKWIRVNTFTSKTSTLLSVYESQFLEAPVSVQVTAYYSDSARQKLLVQKHEKVTDSPTDLAVHSFSIPKFENGMHLKMEIEREFLYPEFFGRFFLQETFPVVSKTIRLHFPEQAKIKYGLQTTGKVKAGEQETTTKGSRVVSVTAANLPPLRKLEGPMVPAYMIAALYVSFPPRGLSSYSWQELGDHYLDNFGEVYDISPEMKAWMQAQPQGDMPEGEALKQRFESVTQKVRYYGDWRGRFAFFPRKAPDIFNNGYGDCKEYTTLLQTVLSKDGVRANPVLIASGNVLQISPWYPTLSGFNHMLLAVELRNGTNKFLDPTHVWANGENSYYSLIGRKGLLIKKGGSKIVEVDAGKDFVNNVKTKSTIVKDKKSGKWMLKGEVQLFGYPSLLCLENMKYSPIDNEERFIHSFLLDEFGIHAREFELLEITAQKTVISYLMEFDEHHIAIGQGGLNLKVPRPFNMQTKYNGKFLHFARFEQEDEWLLPFAPRGFEIESTQNLLGDISWKKQNRKVVRHFSQESSKGEMTGFELKSWRRDMAKMKKAVVWR